MTEALKSAGERLRWARENAGYKTGEEAAQALSFKSVTYRSYENDQAGFSRHATKFARAFNVPIGWLLDGGSLDLNTENGEALSSGSALSINVEFVKMVDIAQFVGGGTETTAAPDVSSVPFTPQLLLEYAKGTTDQLRVTKGHGDSMEPTLRREDHLMIDTSQVSVFMQDEIWALTHAGAGMIRRLRKLPREKVAIISDNPSVSDYEVDAAEIVVVGKVVWVGRGL